MQIDGGDRLEKRLNEIARNLTKASSVRVGFLEGATYPDGKSVAMVAAINEFGAPSRGQPPRPFFRGMVKAKSGGWPDTIERLLLANDYDTEKTLRQMGEGIAGQLREAIVTFEGAPLAPSTIRRKGHAKPLVDTGHMLQSVDYEVE